MSEKKRFSWFRRNSQKPAPAAGTNPLPGGQPPAPVPGAGAPPAKPSHPPRNHPAPPPHPHRAGGEHRGNHRGSGGDKLRVVPLGGLEEVGKNCMVFEYKQDMILVDCGLSFADGDMLGVDYIIPDLTYAEQRKRNIKAVIFTHAHLDHIGAVQHMIPRLGNPLILATKLAAGLIKGRLREFGLDKSAKIKIYDEDSKFQLGQFKVEFFNVNHSIPEGKGVVLHSPAGTAVHTGDFKFDHSPAVDKPVDFQRIAEIGKKGVDVLFSDSTNSSKPGFCKTEMEIARTLEHLIEKTKGRLIIASFSSLIGRMNQICNFAAKNGRTVFASGRSMVENLKLAEELGYTTYPKGTVRKIDPSVNKLPPHKVLIITTGAQGEAMSALTRMAMGEHKQIQIRPGDTVVLSSSPIPGNETAVTNVVNNLFMLGAHVVTNKDMDVHVSGHAHQEELKIMYRLLTPRCLVPIHGEWFMRKIHENVIREIDPSLLCKILENGDVLEISKQEIRKSKEKIPANDMIIDGLGFGDIGSQVLKERAVMSKDGVVVLLFRAYDKTKNLIGEPDVISRGFLYAKELPQFTDDVKKVGQKCFENAIQKNRQISLKDLKAEIEANVARFIRKRLAREPMILPVITYF